MPQVLGTGYGWIQHGLGPQLRTMPLWIVLALPFARILATGLSIGSGGSGGIFGPGMVIGAFVGAAVWRLFEPIVPGMGSDPAPFVIVGMMCCFGSVARAPLAVLLMVAEMTGSVKSIEPGMIAVGLAWLIVWRTDVTMYRSQLIDRGHAPGHRLLEDVPLLEGSPVAEAMSGPRLVLIDDASVAEARVALAAAGADAAPVVDRDERFEGSVNAAALLAGKPQERLRDLVDAGAATVPLGSTVDVAVDALAAGDSTFVTVLDGERRVRGTIAIADLAAAYRRELRVRAATSDMGAQPDGTPAQAIRSRS
jgi:CBS domain-containing protein